MTKVPFKWDTVDSSGKVGINLDKTAAFTSDSAALTVDGNVAASNIASMASDIGAQASQISGLGTRISAVESVLPSGTVKATSSMAFESGEVSGLEDNTARLYSNGLGIKKIHSVWFGAKDSGPDIEFAAGAGAGNIYLRRYSSSNTVEKEATLLDSNGDATFPSTITAVTFSGNLNGNAATASSAAQASNANTVASLAVSSGRNNVPNQVMRTDSSGIAQFGKIDTLATDLSSSPMTKVYCSDNNEIKSKSVDNFINALGFGFTPLLSQPLTSDSVTINISGYNSLLFIGKGGSSTPAQTLTIPISYLDSTEKSFSFTHGYNSQYTYIYLSISNSILTIRFGGSSNNGSLQAVYGVK